MKVEKQIKLLLSFLTGLFVIGGLFGVRYGLPFHLVGDEEALIGGALTMLELKTIFPVFNEAAFAFLYYPVLMPYSALLAIIPFALGVWALVPAVSSASSLSNYLLINLSEVWVAARLPSIFAGALMVWALYRLANAVFVKERFAGLFASLFILTSFFHFQLSVVTRHWIWSTLLLVTALYFLFKSNFTVRRDAMWAGVCVGLASGFGQIGLITAFFVALSYVILNNKQRFLGLGNKHFWMFAGLGLGGFVFFVATHPGAFDYIIAGEETTHLAAKSITYYLAEFYHSATYLVGKELIVFILGIIGGMLLFVRNHKKELLVCVSIIVLHNLFLFTFFHNAPRYQLYIVPLFALMAGYALSVGYRYVRGIASTYAVIAGYTVLFVLSGFSTVWYGMLLHRPTTEQAVYAWMQQHPDAVYLIDSRSLEMLQEDSFVAVQENYGRARAQNRALVGIDAGVYGGQKYAYTNIHFWDDAQVTQQHITDFINTYHPDYYIVSFDDVSELSKMSHQVIGSYATYDQSFTNYGSEVRGVARDAFSDFGIFNNHLYTIDRFGQNVYVFSFNNPTL